MRTYVAEINGEAIVAFRADNGEHAQQLADEKDGGLQLGLNGYSGLTRADGKMLWDGKSEIKARPATDAEHHQWLKVRDAEIGDAADGKQIDPEIGDSLDDLRVYLIPTIPVDDDDLDDVDDDDVETAVKRKPS